MEKLKSILKWVGTDGLLHFLVCYALMLTLSPVVGKEWASGITAFVAVAKEAYDLYKKKNNIWQALHDIVCDGVGIGTSYFTMWMWTW